MAEQEPQYLEVVSTDARELRQSFAGLQAGVMDAGDLKVTAGTGLTVDVAAGVAFVQGSNITQQGLYRVYNDAAKNSAAFTLGSIPSNASGQPRIDQVIARVMDQSHDGSGLRLWRLEYVAGVGTAAATLDNRNGAISDVALGNNWLRLADVRVNNGASTPTEIRDRRKWARGAFGRMTSATPAATTTTSAADLDATNLTRRFELSGVPVRLLLGLAHATSTADTGVAFSFTQDGSTLSGGVLTSKPGEIANAHGRLFEHVYTPSAGSHLLTVRWQLAGDSAGTTSTVTDVVFTVEETPSPERFELLVIDFWLCDLQGRSLGSFADRQGSVTLTLNEGRKASVTASFDDPTAAKVRALSTVVKASWDRGHLFTGVVTRPQFQGRARRVVVPAQDPSFKLAAAYVNDRVEPGLLGAFTGDDQGDILMTLIYHADEGLATVDPNPIPGLGLEAGVIIPSRTRDRAYPSGKNIWEAVRELSAVIDGVDFDLRPVDQTDGIFALVDVHYPMMGADKTASVIFEYGWGLENVVDCDVEEAGDLVHSRATRIGKRDDVTLITPGAREIRYDSLGTFGHYASYVAETDIEDEATLREHALASVTAYAFPPFFVKMTPAQDDGSGYRADADGNLTLLPKRYGSPPILGPNASYWLGDVVSVVVRDGPAFDFELQARIVQIVLSNAPNGAVVAELTLAPVLGGGYRLPGVLPPSFAREFGSLRERLRISGVVQ